MLAAAESHIFSRVCNCTTVIKLVYCLVKIR